MMSKVLLEICCGSAEDALVAARNPARFTRGRLRWQGRGVARGAGLGYNAGNSGKTGGSGFTHKRTET